MKAVKAIYKNGKVELSERPRDPGPIEVVVVFPEASDDPWEKVLAESKPRPAMSRVVRQVRKEILQGKAKPLDLKQL